LQFYLTIVVSLTATAVVACADSNKGMFCTSLSLFQLFIPLRLSCRRRRHLRLFL